MRYTLITGASAGIGLELARVYAAQAQNLILVARSEEKLKRIAEELTEQYKIQVHYYSTDLSKPEQAKKLVHWTRQNAYDIEYLINNAGFGSYGEFHKSDLQNEWEMLQLNIMSLMYLTRAYLPRMVFQNRGGVLNVASIAGFMPGPRMANYYASKAYVVSFTQALAEELRNTALKISVLCPGPVRTDFYKRSKFNLSRRLLPAERFMLSASDVARYTYEEYQKGEKVIIPGTAAKVAVFLARKKPMKVVRWIVSHLQ